MLNPKLNIVQHCHQTSWPISCITRLDLEVFFNLLLIIDTRASLSVRNKIVVFLFEEPQINNPNKIGMTDISHDIGPFPLTGSSELYPLSVCISPIPNVFTCCAVSKQLQSFIIDTFLFKKISDPMFLYLQLQFRMLRVQFGIFFYTGCNSGYTITGYIKINNNIPVSQDKWIYGQDIIHIIEVYIKPGKYVVY